MMIGLDGKAASLFSQYNYIQLGIHTRNLAQKDLEPLSQPGKEEKIGTSRKMSTMANGHKHSEPPACFLW